LGGGCCEETHGLPGDTGTVHQVRGEEGGRRRKEEEEEEVQDVFYEPTSC